MAYSNPISEIHGCAETGGLAKGEGSWEPGLNGREKRLESGELEVHKQG